MDSVNAEQKYWQRKQRVHGRAVNLLWTTHTFAGLRAPALAALCDMHVCEAKEIGKDNADWKKDEPRGSPFLFRSTVILPTGRCFQSRKA